MRTLSIAIGLILCLCGTSFAQSPPAHKPAAPKATRTLPKPDPAELRRCALSPKILNAASRSACRGRSRQHG